MMPETSIGKLLRVTEYGKSFDVGNIVPDKEQKIWMLVEILTKRSIWPNNSLEEPDYSREALYGLSFLINGKLYTLNNILGKDFSKYFELVDNETK